MTKRRDFLKKAGVATAGAVAATTLSAPHVKAQNKIKWRLQTYAGAALAEHVIKPAIDDFNKAANGDMEIELYTADQLVPTGELFRAMQRGTIDAVQSDEDSMSAPVDVSLFGGYFPFATRYSLDVPVLFNQYGLKEIWEEAYAEIENVKWLSAGLGTRATSTRSSRSVALRTSRACGSTPSPPPDDFFLGSVSFP